MLGQNFTRRIISQVRRAQHGGMLIIIRTEDAMKIVDPIWQQFVHSLPSTLPIGLTSIGPLFWQGSHSPSRSPPSLGLEKFFHKIFLRRQSCMIT
jgi:hypothetical protein